MLLDYKDAKKAGNEDPENVFDYGDGAIDFLAAIVC